MHWFNPALLLIAALSGLLGQQPAAPASPSTDPQIAWEFDSGG